MPLGVRSTLCGAYSSLRVLRIDGIDYYDLRIDYTLRAANKKTARFFDGSGYINEVLKMAASAFLSCILPSGEGLGWGNAFFGSFLSRRKKMNK